MARKFYFHHNDSELCYTEEYFQDIMHDEGLKEIEVFDAIPEKIPGVFWCKHECFCGDDTADTCGKQCKFYDPRNGVSGCCRHHTSWLRTHGNKIILKRKEVSDGKVDEG